MKKVLAIIVLLIIAVAAAWYLSVRQDQKAIEQAEVAPPPDGSLEQEAQPEAPRIEHPVEQIRIAPAPEPLPALEESDAEVSGQLEDLLGAEPVERYVLADKVISRAVATADSLTSARTAPLMLPVVPAEGQFMVLEAEDQAVISPQNAERYDAYVQLIDGVDTAQAVALYTRYYPLFQEAYQDLGYPEGYFNDRLVEVIDHLLATPEPAGQVRLVRNEAVWEYQDPQLEALSAGQKILIRMGNDNARIVKAKLRELRERITGLEGAGLN